MSRTKVSLALFEALLLTTALGTLFAQGTISTIAGTDAPFLSPQATQAALAQTYGVAVAPDGTLYVSDTLNHIVASASPQGVLQVLIGTGKAGYSGDGGPGTAAQLNGPTHLVLDSKGNLYINDIGNKCIRKFNNGVVTTVAKAPNGITGMAVDATGVLYVATFGDPGVLRPPNPVVAKLVGSELQVIAGGSLGIGGPGDPSGGFPFFFISSICVGPDSTIYVADINAVWAFREGNTVSLAAGGSPFGSPDDGISASAAKVQSAAGMQIDAQGNLLLSIPDESRVRIVKARDGSIFTIAGVYQKTGFSGDGGPAQSAWLTSPAGLALDAAGNIFIADGPRVRRVAGETISTAAGNGHQPFFGGDGQAATSAFLNFPSSVAMNSQGSLFIADQGNNRIRRVAADGNISTFAGTGAIAFRGDGGPADAAALSTPSALAIDRTGNVFVADESNKRIRRIEPNGPVTTFAGNGSDTYSPDGTATAQSALGYVVSLAADANGNIYAVETSQHRVRKISADGTISTIAGNGQMSYSGDGGPATNAGMDPQGIAVDSAGVLYVADTANNRIRKVEGGTVTTFAGNGYSGFLGDGGPATSASLSQPLSLALDATGNLFVCIYGGVRKINPAGIISTIAGTGVAGFFGDGGPAIKAQIRCLGMTVDNLGNLIIADAGNNRVRKVVP